MWELAPRFGAKIVFAEHRYEGESLPANLTTDCLSYASTIQALEDYARLLEEEVDPGHRSPVVVFGGSYGGMLSAWMVGREFLPNRIDSIPFNSIGTSPWIHCVSCVCTLTMLPFVSLVVSVSVFAFVVFNRDVKRMKYPHLVAGAIAASAPIGA